MLQVAVGHGWISGRRWSRRVVCNALSLSEVGGRVLCGNRNGRHGGLRLVGGHDSLAATSTRMRCGGCGFGFCLSGLCAAMMNGTGYAGHGQGSAPLRNAPSLFWSAGTHSGSSGLDSSIFWHGMEMFKDFYCQGSQPNLGFLLLTDMR